MSIVHLPYTNDPWPSAFIPFDNHTFRSLIPRQTERRGSHFLLVNSPNPVLPENACTVVVVCCIVVW
jgi:hypothetical protein